MNIKNSINFTLLLSIFLIPNIAISGNGNSEKSVNILNDNEKSTPFPFFMGTEAERPYDRLVQLYWNGFQPSVDELNGWHTGRCYRQDSIQATNALLILIEEGDSNGGPLFPGGTNKILVIENRSQPSDYYDVITQEKSYNIMDVIRNAKDHITLVSNYQNSLYSYNLNAKIQYNVKKYYDYSGQSYFINKNVVTTSGETIDMCYFFRRVGW